MTTQNISRSEGRHKKRDISVFACKIGVDEMFTSADVFQLAQLPKNIIIISASLTTIVAYNSATSAVLDIGWAGGDELFDGTNIKATAGTEVASSLVPLLAETGGVLTAKPVFVGAPTAGEVLLTIEYVEYEQCTGELTNFVE